MGNPPAHRRNNSAWPTRTGYTLTGWAGPDGTTNTTPNSYTIPENTSSHTTIRAQWEANSYTIAFSANGGQGEMSDITATYDQSVTLPANTLTRAGYTFTGWNTAASGSGTPYADGAAVRNLTDTANDTVILYAQWEAGPVTVSFHPNGGTLAATDSSKTVTYQEEYGALPTPAREDYTFTGWYLTASPGEGDAAITADSKVENPEAHTLYAQWDYNYFTLEFDLQGGVGSAFDTQKVEKKTGTTLPEEEPTRAGWEFTGWCTSQGEGGMTYQPGAQLKYTGQEKVTLYALWDSDEPFITYNPNADDAKIPFETTQFLVEGKAEIPTDKPTREGYAFQGWGLAADGKVAYNPGETVYSADSITLYAIWQTTSVAGDVVTITLVDPRGAGTNGSYTETTQKLVVPKDSQFTLPEIEAVEFLGWKNSTSTNNSAQYAGGEGLVAEKDASYTAVYANENMYWKWRANSTDPWNASSTLTRATDSINEKSGNEKLIVLLKTQDMYTSTKNETITAGNYTIDLNGLYPYITLEVNAGGTPVTDMVIQNGTMVNFLSGDNVCNVIIVKEGCGQLLLKNLTLTGVDLPGITVHRSNTVTLDDVKMRGLIADGNAKIIIEYAEIGDPSSPYYNRSSVSSEKVLINLQDTSTLTIQDGYFWRAANTTNRDLIHAASNAMLNIQGGYFAQTNGGNSSWGNWSESETGANKFYQTGATTDGHCAIWNEGGSDLAFSEADPKPDGPKGGYDVRVVWYAVTGSASEAPYWEINGSEVSEKYPEWSAYNSSVSISYELLRWIEMGSGEYLSIGGDSVPTTVDLNGRIIEAPASQASQSRAITLINTTVRDGMIRLHNYIKNASITLQKDVTVGGDVLLAAHTITLDDSVVFEPGARLVCNSGLDTTNSGKLYGETVLRLVGTSNDDVG